MSRPRATKGKPAPYRFDVEGLAAEEGDDEAQAAPAAPAPEALEVFAFAVRGRVAPDAQSRLMTFDPAWVLVIVQVVAAIVKRCKERQVKARLERFKANPDGFRSRLLVRRIARRLPPKWGAEEAELVARGMLEQGAANLDGEMWGAVFATGEDAEA